MFAYKQIAKDEEFTLKKWVDKFDPNLVRSMALFAIMTINSELHTARSRTSIGYGYISLLYKERAKVLRASSA